MPELPEVETVRKIIEPQICGQRIISVLAVNPQIIAYPDTERFTVLIQGKTVIKMSLRGKFLTIHFNNGDRLCLHLRMTGQLLVLRADEPVEKHTHLNISLSSGNQLRYIDVRRFGRFWYFQNGEADVISGQSLLGPEPADPVLTSVYLKEKLGRSNRPIKGALLDQTVIAGIGNIYSDEILFAAGIYPGTKCSALADSDWEHLAKKIPEIILWGIEANEMTPDEYLAGKGRDYREMSGLRAYGRTGQPCAVCGGTMEKTTVCGRTSCFCPNCQKKPPC
ncbi:MAG: DNA-formamidopyrimidine glycosylase [Cloacibacillus sp.]